MWFYSKKVFKSIYVEGLWKPLTLLTFDNKLFKNFNNLNFKEENLKLKFYSFQFFALFQWLISYSYRNACEYREKELANLSYEKTKKKSFRSIVFSTKRQKEKRRKIIWANLINCLRHVYSLEIQKGDFIKIVHFESDSAK